MTSVTVPTTATAAPPRRNLLKLLASETKFEFLKLLRLPVYSVATLAFPLMFYLIFGTFYGSGQAQGIDVSRYLMATFGAAGVLSAALFSFGVGVASERGQGWMRLKRVSPMPPIAYFLAKIGMALLFGAMVVVVVTAAGMITQGVRIGILDWLSLLGVLLTGALPFGALGLALGYMFGPNSAPVVLNLLYMPMAFASGLWMPITILPPVVQSIAKYLPTYHYAQLAISTVGATPIGDSARHALILVGFTVLFLIVAVIGYKRDEGKTYG
ncbi:MAG TPA: ABC transporter permease [Trueperaceae bacterium]